LDVGCLLNYPKPLGCRRIGRGKHVYEEDAVITLDGVIGEMYVAVAERNAVIGIADRGN
jgi:hypothetical protein